MLFNSFTFVIFLPIVFSLYWMLQKAGIRYQNLLIIVASYVFYGWWDYRFLSLIILSSLVDYTIGILLDRSENPVRRKLLLLVSLSINLGILGFFKYFGFFVTSFVNLLNTIGYHPDIRTLNVILPVGISFYTFQTLSYTIDVYRRKIETTYDPISFFAFVAFFPQLVAGPIERASSLLPQFQRKRTFQHDEAVDGLRQMLWGMFKKVVIADYVAITVNAVYLSPNLHDGISLLIATFLFAIQIYCDFSGYSDIAIGTARLFGFNLMQNFAFPYFSRDIAEFWRRWHISLSTWFRDYVYIPLGGSYSNTKRRILNILITFTVSGLWHGANWTFVIWGLLNGLYYIPLMLARKQKRYTAVVADGRLLPTSEEFARMFNTMLLVMLAWVFFRAESLTQALSIIGRMFSHPYAPGFTYPILPVVAAVILLIIEWFQRDKQHALQIGNLPVVVRWIIYQTVAILILLSATFGDKEFIYFQF